jgi:hypothetical protein
MRKPRLTPVQKQVLARLSVEPGPGVRFPWEAGRTLRAMFQNGLIAWYFSRRGVWYVGARDLPVAPEAPRAFTLDASHVHAAASAAQDAEGASALNMAGHFSADQLRVLLGCSHAEVLEVLRDRFSRSHVQGYWIVVP